MTARHDARIADIAALCGATGSRRSGTGRSRRLLAAALVGLFGFGGEAFGQARPGAPAAAPAARPQGLDSLSEEAVMNELAGRGLNTLLNRVFDERKVPTAERDSFKALQALRELGAAQSLPDSRRIELMARAADGVGMLLSQNKISDGNQLMTYAATLIGKAIEPDVNILDYWGDNPIRQQRIAVPSKLAVEMLMKASTEAAKKSEEMQNQIRAVNDPRIAQVEQLETLVNQAKYVAKTSMYYQILAVDVSGAKAAAGMAERKKLKDDAIAYLKDFATNDSGAAPVVLMRIARMKTAAGDYAGAKADYQQIIDGKIKSEQGAPVEMTPAPTEWQQNEARYFSVVCDVLAKKPAEADKGFESLVAWQKTVKDDSFNKATIQNDAQRLMLKYRILTAKADAAAAGAPRQGFEREAEVALEDLGKLSPAFSSLVAEQLVSRVKDDTDLTKLGTPVLQALMARGVMEWRKPANDPSFDQKTFDRGFECAKVIAARKPDAATSTAAIEGAAINIALFLQRQGKNVEAANQFLDYATNDLNKGKEKAAQAVDQAEWLATQAYIKNSQDKATVDLWDRMLEVAANPPYDRERLHYFYAERLRLKAQDAPRAIAFYAKVKKGDKKEYDARYWQMVLGVTQIEKVKDPALKNQKVREVLDLATQVRALAQAAKAGADAATASRAQFRLAHSTITEAELAMQQVPPQPQRTLQVLNGIEQTVAGLKEEQGILGRAMYLRARAYINTGQLEKAIEQVQQMAADPKLADFAVGMVQELLKQLETDKQVAKKAGDKIAQGEKANQQAKLAGLLMPFADKEKDANKKATMKREIAFYDAALKFEAGENLPAGPEKQQRLKEALDAFVKLKADNKEEDVRMDINIGKCQYELGELMNSMTTFATLVQRQKLGTPTINVPDIGGNVVQKDNPDFWEVHFKLNMARLKYSKENAGNPEAAKALDAAKKAVGSLFIVHGDKVGGEQWKEEFNDLKTQLGVAGAATTQPSADPATQPTAAN